MARQKIALARPRPSERSYLRLRGGEPVLTMTRTAFYIAGKAVESATTATGAEDYALEMVVDQR